MRYIEPAITNVLKADSAIQGIAKMGATPDHPENQPSASVGYSADE